MSTILKLDAHVQKDPRMLTVYRKARRLYGQEKRQHHNFQHVLRDLYRALLIAEEENAVDFSVLIPAVLLHDIGFLDPDSVILGHDVTGASFAERFLEDFGYEDQEIDAIVHCIRAHKGKAEMPQTIEAKILYDADVLEKSGLAYLIFGGKIICEFEESIESFLNRETADRTSEINRGLFTGKGRDLDAGRLVRTRDLLVQSQREITVDRKDYAVDESDLWEDLPPETEQPG